VIECLISVGLGFLLGVAVGFLACVAAVLGDEVP
jgi:hypothetical protein